MNSRTMQTERKFLIATLIAFTVLWFGLACTSLYYAITNPGYLGGAANPWHWPFMTFLGVLGTVGFGRLASKLLLKMRGE